MRVWIFVTGLACVACGGPSNERLLTEEDFGDDWPFTVAAGTVRCVQNAVTFDADGVTYAVNGRASLAVYRMVFGQPRQDDLMAYLLDRLRDERLNELAPLLQIDLTPR